MKHILLLEDDTEIAREIENHLGQEGHLVTILKSITQCKVLDFSKFDLLVFDWNLPDGESIELVKEIRNDKINTPVLMLTANTDLPFRTKALEMGASDFLGKPFYFHELKARIDLLFSSIGHTHKISNVISTSGIEIVLDEVSISYKGQTLTVTKKEFDLFVFFLRHPNTVFSRNEILDAVWGVDESPSPRTVDTHMLALRKKTKNELFLTVWNSGYRFIPEENLKKNKED